MSLTCHDVRTTATTMAAVLSKTETSTVIAVRVILAIAVKWRVSHITFLTGEILKCS